MVIRRKFQPNRDTNYTKGLFYNVMRTWASSDKIYTVKVSSHPKPANHIIPKPNRRLHRFGWDGSTKSVWCSVRKWLSSRMLHQMHSNCLSALALRHRARAHYIKRSLSRKNHQRVQKTWERDLRHCWLCKCSDKTDSLVSDRANMANVLRLLLRICPGQTWKNGSQWKEDLDKADWK